MMIHGNSKMPERILVRGVYVNRDLFVEICTQGSMSAQQARIFWDEAMYDIFTGKARSSLIQDIVLAMFERSLGHRFKAFWEHLAQDEGLSTQSVTHLKEEKNHA